MSHAIYPFIHMYLCVSVHCSPMPTSLGLGLLCYLVEVQGPLPQLLLHLPQVARNKGREATCSHSFHHRQMRQVCGFSLKAWGRLPGYVCWSPCTTQSIMPLGRTMLSPRNLGQTYLLFHKEIHIDNT